MTVMKNNARKKQAVENGALNNESAAERAVALMHQAIDVIRRTEQIPVTPVSKFLPEHLRRELRRNARRLRQHKTQPRYPNLHSAEELAELYERTVLRDEMLEQGKRELDGISRELEAIPDVPEVRYAVGMLAREAGVAAEIDGPGSEAAERFRLLAEMVDHGHQHLFDRRRQRIEPPSHTHPAADLSLEALQQAAAADLLAAAPPGEPVISFPPEGHDSGRGRILFRIGLREASWIGSFERGEVKKNTVRVLPDRKHLFVCAEGAGYVIELQSRTLVQTTGTRITGVMYDNPVTLFIVKHNDTSLEAFGRAGRLWKTDTIGTGGFRGIEITEDSLRGEARHPLGWMRFSVGMKTGVVVLGDVRRE
ncbi:MAG: hypothetical protein JWO56_2078 [Acidobacteria bacterium]|nr:hypothetical protein [Acidobacteriota bacterium]